MSSYIKNVLLLLNYACSMIGSTVERAVIQLRPLQNPCYSPENSLGMSGCRRYTNIFIRRRYHTLVTLIGRKLLGTSVVLSRLGMAVSKESSNDDSIPVSNTFYNKSRSSAAN